MNINDKIKAIINKAQCEAIKSKLRYLRGNPVIEGIDLDNLDNTDVKQYRRVLAYQPE